MSRSKKDRPKGHRKRPETWAKRPGNSPGGCSVLSRFLKKRTHKKERKAGKKDTQHEE